MEKKLVVLAVACLIIIGALNTYFILIKKYLSEKKMQEEMEEIWKKVLKKALEHSGVALSLNTPVICDLQSNQMKISLNLVGLPEDERSIKAEELKAIVKIEKGNVFICKTRNTLLSPGRNQLTLSCDSVSPGKIKELEITLSTPEFTISGRYDEKTYPNLGECK